VSFNDYFFYHISNNIKYKKKIIEFLEIKKFNVLNTDNFFQIKIIKQMKNKYLKLYLSAFLLKLRCIYKIY
jgi:hypothetical protein